MKKYHVSIGFPSTIAIPETKVKLFYTPHALSRRKREGEKFLKTIPRYIKINNDIIQEIHSIDDIHCKKIVVRLDYDDNRDIVLVLEPQSKNWSNVVTLWLNKKKDRHKTLNKTNYDIPTN